MFKFRILFDVLASPHGEKRKTYWTNMRFLVLWSRCILDCRILHMATPIKII
jgi:hypothetical protein